MDRSGLPPLESLRAFDAAARHLSFTRAAEELFLTQSAVSKQIIALETALGTRLFERRTRALALTEAGDRLAKAVTAAFAALREATGIILAGEDPSITLATTPAFTDFWLIPRLGDFRKRNPGIDIRLSAEMRKVDLEREGFDLAIRFFPDAEVPPGAHRLFGGRLSLVCSPRLMEQTPLRTANDLEHHVLLDYQDESRQLSLFSWQQWLEVAGVPGLRPAGTITFQQYEPAVRAAVEGQGIALAPHELVADMLRDGRLVTPLDLSFAFPGAYYLLTSPRAEENPAVPRFAEWLLAQAARET